MKRITLSIFASLMTLCGLSHAQYGTPGSYPIREGEHRLAIIILDWSDKAAGASRQELVNHFWNNPRSVRNHYLDMSRGLFEIKLPDDAAPDGTVPANTQDVYGPYELSIAAGYSEDITNSNAASKFGGSLSGSFPVARSLAEGDGFRSSDYDYIIYFTPGSAAGTRDWAYIGGYLCHLKGLGNAHHEMGHTLWLHHSNTSIDKDNYASQDCPMATGSPHFDGPHTYQLGYYPESCFGLKTYGQYDIENLAEPGSDELKVLRFDRAAHGATSNPSYNLWVEYRRKGIGHDAGLNDEWNGKVNIHYCAPISKRSTDGHYFNSDFNNNVAKFQNSRYYGDYTDPDGICSVRFLRTKQAANGVGEGATVQLIDPNGNQPPVIEDDQTVYFASGTNNFSIHASDPEDDDLVFSIVTQPASGSLTLNGDTFTYTGSTPGSFDCTIRANDGQYDSYDQIVTITVVGPAAPIANPGINQTLAYPTSLPWDPRAIQAVLWLDGADADTIIHNSGEVSQWSDKSGNNNHAVQAIAGLQPTYNSSDNKLIFDKDIMQITNDPMRDLQNFAAIAVQRWNGSGGGSSNNAVSYGGFQTGWRIGQNAKNSSQFIMSRIGTDGAGNPSVPAATNSEDFIGVGLRQNSQDITVRNNGAVTYSASNDTGFIRYVGVNRSGVGGRYTEDGWTRESGHLKGDVKEIIVIDEATTEVVEKVEGYLAHKWNVTAKLPETHPYKTAPPMASGTSVLLSGSATDADGDVVLYTWSIQSAVGGTASIAKPTSPVSLVTFSDPGTYVLRLTASDGVHSHYDDVTITLGDTPSGLTVTFDKRGGSGGSDSVSATLGEAMPTASAPTLSGHVFLGYYSAADGSGDQYYTSTMASARNWDIDANTTLYALWAETYANWSGSAAFSDDSNNDSVTNGLAWLLGAAEPDANARDLLPQMSRQTGGELLLSFSCLKSVYRAGASLKVQASDDLGTSDAWSNQEAEVPDISGTINGIDFTITPHSNPELIQVEASIPPTSAGKCFGRLQGSP